MIDWINGLLLANKESQNGWFLLLSTISLCAIRVQKWIQVLNWVSGIEGYGKSPKRCCKTEIVHSNFLALVTGGEGVMDGNFC